MLGEKSYDADFIIEAVAAAGMEAVIPPKKNRKVQRDYDKGTYKWRRLVENAFLHLKRCRGIATPYAKATAPRKENRFQRIKKQMTVLKRQRFDVGRVCPMQKK